MRRWPPPSDSSRSIRRCRKRSRHERLPVYAPASAHLAAALVATGERERAIALLQAVAASSDDPEYWGQLAALVRDDELAQKAKRRYEALLRRHPQAFADHAARFF